ncbi:hypothetical protein F4805DRAFT_467031 [Annulohypoxylon moriforme]|nr:hypothetical protein F4805DRAFT_467031 [Annulohypoxylon moriforme]
MVGALKRNRCDTCRKRKVKCDECWPICGQCKRSNRFCPPRSALKIVDDGAKVRSAMQGKMTPYPGRGDSSNSQSSGSILVGTNRNVNVDVNRPTPLTPSERLAFGLINSLQVDNQSYRLSVIGEFMWEVPRHLGRSDALDAVTNCLIVTHKNVLDGGHQDSQIHPQSYNRALQSVRKAIIHPKSWSSSDTLCATILLHRLEAVFGTYPNFTIEVHAAGLAALLEKRGPPNSADKLDFQTTVDSHISIQKDCFLASPKWGLVLDEKNGRSDTQMIYYRLVREMTIWPTLVRENAQLQQGDLTINTNRVVEKGLCVLEQLRRIDDDLTKLLSSQKLMGIKPSEDTSSLVPAMFEVKDKLAAMLVCHYGMYSIVVHRIVLSQLYRGMGGDGTQTQRHLESEMMRQCKRIWMLIDYSRCHKPFGLPIMTPALMMTYGLAQGPVAQGRIIDIMNELDTFRFRNKYWDVDQISHNINSLLGPGHW